jgi:hypothetical protein
LDDFLKALGEMAGDEVIRKYRQNKDLEVRSGGSARGFYRTGEAPRIRGKVIEFNQPSTRVREDERAGS